MDRGATNNGNGVYRLPHMNNFKHNVKLFKKKVVHLVRDPRASLSSMMHEKSTWTSKLANFKARGRLLNSHLIKSLISND